MYQLLKEHIRKFISIPDQDLDTLTSFFTPRQLKKKDHLFRQNDQCRQLAFVNKGCLRNYHIDGHGEEQIVYFATEEWWVGDMQSFFLQIPSMFNLQALEDCELLLSTKAEFESALETIPAFEKFYRLKTQTAYTKTQKTVVEKTQTAEERYKKLLTTSPYVKSVNYI